MEPTAAAKQDLANQVDADVRLRLPFAMYIVLALIAGAIFFGIYKNAFPVYHIPKHLLRSFPTDEDAVKREIEKKFAKTLHVALSMGILAFLLSFLFGCAEASKRGLRGSAFLKVLLGSIAATAIGCLGGWLGAIVFFQLEKISALNPMSRTFLAQALMMGLVGMGVGVTMGFLVGSTRMLKACAGAGFMAAASAAAGFLIVTAFALPSVQSDSLIPDGSAGVFGCVTEAGTMGVATWAACIVLAVCLIRPIVNRATPLPAANSPATEVAPT